MMKSFNDKEDRDKKGQKQTMKNKLE